MKFINSIEIKYFRSIHHVRLKNISDLSVFSGRNDVGKSNLIKALSMFFGSSSEFVEEFEFYENFSNKRLNSVRQKSVKGRQFISIKLEFLRPRSYKNSLPEKFSVERIWHRDSRTFESKNNFEALHKVGKLPGTLAAANKSLTKFLNKIHFEYVPAIKDKSYFKSLLIKLQEELLNTASQSKTNIVEAAENLADDISDQIEELKREFESATTIKTSIKPPTKLADLFQSFAVSTSTEYGDIPLKARGDGLQARYIASALNYFAHNNRSYFIWGFEEPEIALEYLHATKLAADFLNNYTKNAQIFVTSHSPAFTSLEDTTVNCFRVYKEDNETRVINVSKKANTTDNDLLNQELGIHELQKEVHEKYAEKLQELESQAQFIEKLKKEIKSLTQTIVLTEGKTDKLILETAYQKLYGKLPEFAIRCCDNETDEKRANGGANNLQKMIETVHPEDDRIVIALFDYDDEGLQCFNKLMKSFKIFENDEEVKKHSNESAFAMLLPVPSFRKEVKESKSFCIEFMFSDEIMNRTDENQRGLKVVDLPATITSACGRKSLAPDQLELIRSAGVDIFPTSKKIEGDKVAFAERIVPLLEEADFDAFKILFEKIELLIETQ